MADDGEQRATVSLATDGLSAEVALLGAELVRLRDEAGRDLLWNGDPAFWTGRAPLLFPIVGRLKGDALHVGGQDYAMRQHGFARVSSFEVLSREPARVDLGLKASDATRKVFPFEFSLVASYRLTSNALEIDIAVTNPGATDLPLSMGFHPALLWPLPYGGARGDHQIIFDKDEPAPLKQLREGLIVAEPRPTPVDGKCLALDDALFARDALIFDTLASRRLRYGAPHHRGVEVVFEDMPHLGIWTKPGAGFVCIEPWQGFASPADFDGDFSAKPGMVRVAPGATRHFGMSIVLDPA